MVPVALKPKHKPVQTHHAALRLGTFYGGKHWRRATVRDFLRRDFKGEPVERVHLAPPFNWRRTTTPSSRRRTARPLPAKFAPKFADSIALLV